MSDSVRSGVRVRSDEVKWNSKIDLGRISTIAHRDRAASRTHVTPSGNSSGQEFVKLLHELRCVLERVKLLGSHRVGIEVHHVRTTWRSLSARKLISGLLPQRI